MMRPQPLICVQDVEASSQWYQRLLNCQSAHGGPNYERLVHAAHSPLILSFNDTQVKRKRFSSSRFWKSAYARG